MSNDNQLPPIPFKQVVQVLAAPQEPSLGGPISDDQARALVRKWTFEGVMQKDMGVKLYREYGYGHPAGKPYEQSDVSRLKLGKAMPKQAFPSRKPVSVSLVHESFTTQASPTVASTRPNVPKLSDTQARLKAMELSSQGVTQGEIGPILFTQYGYGNPNMDHSRAMHQGEVSRFIRGALFKRKRTPRAVEEALLATALPKPGSAIKPTPTPLEEIQASNLSIEAKNWILRLVTKVTNAS